MSYLSPHVHYMICEISGITTDGFLETASGGRRDEEPDKREFFMREAMKIWRRAGRWKLLDCNALADDEFIQNLHWTGCEELIVHCMSNPIELTNLSILKLTVIIERALGDVFTTIKDIRCPSLLKDLLQTDVLVQVFGSELITELQTLMGPPVSLNLRNVVWHGFPLLGEIKQEYCWMLVNGIISLGKSLKEKGIKHIRHKSKLKIPNEDLIDKCFPLITDKNAVFKLFKSTAFIPTGMIPSWKRSMELFLCERHGDAVVMFLPQLEHALRCLFTVVNNCPTRQITAESDAVYTTFDEILAKDIESNTSNRLLSEIGENACEMLYDILYFPEGLRLRDRLSHGEYDFDDVTKCIANHVICAGLCFCVKYLFPWRRCLQEEFKIFAALNESLANYKSVYHPIAFLLRWVDAAVNRIENVTSAAEDTETANPMHAEKVTQLKNKFRAISIQSADLSTSFVDSSEIAMGHLNHRCMIGRIRALIRVKRDVMHRAKSEVEVTGILRKLTKQIEMSSDQIICSIKEKRIQFENRTLRSRARANFMSMLSVVPVLTSFWLILLHIAALAGLAFDGEFSEKLVKHLKKLLKCVENITTFCSSTNNKWSECLGAAEKSLESIQNVLKLLRRC